MRRITVRLLFGELSFLNVSIHKELSVRRLSSVFLLLAFFAAGCSGNQTTRDAWKYTVKQYKSYLNTPASLDMDAKGDGEDYQFALGETARDIDRELTGMMRAIENSGRDVDAEWVFDVMQRFPWLTGVALVDGEGKVIAHYPEYAGKDFDPTPLLQADPKQGMAALRGYARQEGDHTSIYVGNPVFRGEEMRGLVVARFDPRNLLMKSPNPGGFSIASSQGVLWAGNSGAAGSLNWEEEVRKRSSGHVGSSGSGFYWVTRYVGNLPLVYIIPDSATSSTKGKKAE